MAVLTLLLSACAAPRDCALVSLASMPVTVRHNLLLVPAGIGGQRVTLLVDTGATRTVLTQGAVARLGLPQDAHRTRSVGIGGFSTNHDATVPGIVLGHTRFPLHRVAVGRFHIRVGPNERVDGLLGADILLAFEADLNIPGRRLTLYRLRRCPGAEPPWPAERISGVGARRDRMLVPITLDGAAGMAVLDTGAQATTVSAALAKRAGVTPWTLEADPRVTVHGAAPKPISVPRHRFSLLRIGGERIRDPWIAVVPDMGGLGDGLVGDDFIRGRRLWLAFPTRRLFVATPSARLPRPPGEAAPAPGPVPPR